MNQAEVEKLRLRIESSLEELDSELYDLYPKIKDDMYRHLEYLSRRHNIELENEKWKKIQTTKYCT
jgi:hypothetical protein